MIASGVVVFVAAITLGVVDAVAATSSMTLLSTALLLLGVGWSMFLIGGSALLTASVPQHAKVTLQGASDSAMNLGGGGDGRDCRHRVAGGRFPVDQHDATVLLLVMLVFSMKRCR